MLLLSHCETKNIKKKKSHLFHRNTNVGQMKQSSANLCTNLETISTLLPRKDSWITSCAMISVHTVGRGEQGR